MKRVAVIAALPGELRPLVAGWQYEPRDGVKRWRKFPRPEIEWTAACAGIGGVAALRALAEIESREPVHEIISVGWAGALQEKFRAGEAYRVGVVIDAATGMRLRTTGDEASLWLVTTSRILGEKEKRAAAAQFGAGLVDMEAAALAAVAAERGIPFGCIKGVSDDFGDRLPDLAPFVSTAGKFRLAAFLAFAAVRPWHWRGLVRLGKNSKSAAQRMSSVILDDLEKSVA